jgi:hypothetical protein
MSIVPAEMEASSPVPGRALVCNAQRVSMS